PPGGPGASQEQMKQAGRMMRNNLALKQVSIDNRSLADIKQQLESNIQNREIDGYVILPPDLISGGRPEYRARNTADMFTRENIQNAISKVVRNQRLVAAGARQEDIERASKSVDLKSIGEAGQENQGEVGFFL